MNADSLRAILSYDPDTGVFTWLANRGRAYVGNAAGTRRPDGYIIIGLNGKPYRAHRLAWLYVYGKFPQEIDHINGDPSDNRLANLRSATRAQNVANTRKKTNSGNLLKGVTPTKNGRFRAQIRIQGKNTYLGAFVTEQDAHAAYCAAAEKQFGAFFNAG
mgnify:CR=1 FL=1|tara:strand:- start:61 stop:540 length:480 start_codon:yes stop_codon:yes gene_type:complete